MRTGKYSFTKKALVRTLYMRSLEPARGASHHPPPFLEYTTVLVKLSLSDYGSFHT